jgi:hypothetical protein
MSSSVIAYAMGLLDGVDADFNRQEIHRGSVRWFRRFAHLRLDKDLALDLLFLLAQPSRRCLASAIIATELISFRSLIYCIPLSVTSR